MSRTDNTDPYAIRVAAMLGIRRGGNTLVDLRQAVMQEDTWWVPSGPLPQGIAKERRRYYNRRQRAQQHALCVNAQWASTEACEDFDLPPMRGVKRTVLYDLS